jgi:hypothetical protein
VVDHPGYDSGDGHDKGDGQPHGDGGIDLFAYPQKRTDPEEVVEDKIVDEDGYDEDGQQFHS